METESKWDEDLDLLLFVIREVPNDSLGISPFELLYGHRVRGPLQIFKDRLLNKEEIEKVTLTQYIEKLSINLENIRKFAFSNLSNSQEVMKRNFNIKCKEHKFKVGDLVLAYFPIPGSSLQHKYSGPYIVKQCKNNNNYIISTPDRRKSTQLLHVNLLKEYNGVPPTTLLCLTDSNVCEPQTNCKPKPSPPELKSNDILSWEECTNSQIINDVSMYLQHLSPEQKTSLTELLLQYQDICSDIPQLCKSASHDILLLPDTKPIRQQYYRVNQEKLKRMKEEVAYLVRNGLATRSSSPWASPCLLVPKPHGKVRLCTDYRKVNLVTVKDSYPLPRIDDILDSVGRAKFLTQIDLLKGYYQIPLSEHAKLISAFTTPFGLFQYERLPFGLCNAPATFQRAVNGILQDLEDTYAYIDDIVVASDTWEEHLLRLQALFSRLRNAGFTINLAKSTFGKSKVKYLGHNIGCGEIVPKEENISAILDYPAPTNRKAIMRFLGMASYYRKFCKNFSAIATPLIELTSPKKKFSWTESCEKAFDELKGLLSSNPVLAAPDISRPFILQVDACETGVGAVLIQENPLTQQCHPVSYYSHKLKANQKAYSTVEKELLAIVLALQKYEVYFSSNLPITIFTDHNPLTFLDRARFTNQRLLRWSLMLQNFNLRVKYIKGSDNVIADALSRTSAD